MTTRISFLLLLLALASAPAIAADIHDCDREVAHPSDPGRVGEGVPSGSVVVQRAIPACRRAIEEFPDEPRFYYQLGRAIVYWADANDGDYDEGLRHIETAAGKDYTQALFVLALMYARDGMVCETEPLMRQAADQQLKSARLTYVDNVTAGRWDDCKIGASKAEMRAYLDGAQAQVGGYYENMLLGSLRRQLDALPGDER